MYLTRFAIENIRGFLGGEGGTDLRLADGGPGWHVFAGRNGSGKSTLLRALALALVGPDHARALMPSFAGWVRQGTDAAEIRIQLTHAGEDSFQGMGKLPKNTIDAGLTWSRSEGSEPELNGSPDRQKKLVGPWRGPWSDNPRGWLVAGYGPFRRLTGHAADAQRIMVGPYHQKRLVSLFREDASLLEAVSWIQDLQFRKLEKREGAEQLLEDVIALLNDGLLPDQATVARVDSEGLWVERDRSLIELRELSDGYRVALALIIDIVRHMHETFGSVRFHDAKGNVQVDMPGIVLIDEVDAHLHVAWQQRIGFWLTERFPRVQFLVTTHSPFVCQAALAGGLYRLPSPGERRGVESVDTETYRRVVNGSLDDAVLSSLFGMDKTRSDRAEELMAEWSVLRAKLSRHPLTRSERARFLDLGRQLPLPVEAEAAE